MAISIQAAKAKGRKLQQRVRDAILAHFPELSTHDVISCAMGSQGDDIILSQAAREVFPYAIECKAHKNGFTKVYDALAQADRKDGRAPIAIVKQDRCQPIAIMSLDTFLALSRNYRDK